MITWMRKRCKQCGFKAAHRIELVRGLSGTETRKWVCSACAFTSITEREGSFMTKMQEFLDWLGKHHAHFATYSPEEIKAVAIATGFDPIIVDQWEKHARFKQAS